MSAPDLLLQPGSPDGRKPRILIVDDIADNREILSRRLCRRDFETVEAEDGVEALRLIETTRFDLVLMDLVMPRMGGLEALQHIRKAHSASELPVIVVTANAQPGDVTEALAHGANDYVTKPIDFPVALARIASHLERKRAAALLRQTHDLLRTANESLEIGLVEQHALLVEANKKLREEVERRIAADRKTSLLALTDPLTGLANRHACDEQLPRLFRATRDSGAGLAILFLDLDGFKSVNDALGHAAGDMLIKDVAAQMRRVVDRSDLVVRLGGDEFCVMHVVANDARASACALATRLIEAIKGDREVAAQRVYVGVSIGIAVADSSVREAGDLLLRADLAMYRAKADGRGAWRLFEPDMEAQTRDRRAIEMDLRHALARNQFELHYQPIFDLQLGCIIGFEALLRWQRSPGDFAQPQDFIPIAESTGLIVAIGDWVLRQACEEAAAWPDDYAVSVNIAARQLGGHGLLASVTETLATTGLPPHRLELEFSESALVQDENHKLHILQALRALGVRLSLHDFGTGACSLDQVRQAPFDKVKIDRSFVADCGSNADGRAITRAVIGLGDSFGMTTTAKGVETDAQLSYLREQGCKEAQGFLLGRPQSVAITRALIYGSLKPKDASTAA